MSDETYTTQDLIENTMLHALGLLDDDERDAHEQAMLRAPETTRALVLEESRRMADLGDLLPSEDPDPALRELVIAAVRAAVREDENERRLTASPNGASIAGRITHESASRAQKVTQPAVPRGRRVHRAWRAASIGLGAATIALTVVSMNHYQTYQSTMPAGAFGSAYDNLGGRYYDDMIYDDQTQRVSLVSASESSSAMGAAVWYNPDWAKPRLHIKNLRTEPDKPYRLVVLDADGNIVREVMSFVSSGARENFEVDVNLSSESKLAIYESVASDVSANEPLLTSSDQGL